MGLERANGLAPPRMATPASSSPECRTLTIDRALLDDPRRVWAALTDPEQLAAWFWPPRFETEVRHFTLVDAPHGLVQTWTWDGKDHSTLVTFTLSASTGLTVTHEGFSTEEEVASHIAGWNDCLDRLESYLAW